MGQRRTGRLPSAFLQALPEAVPDDLPTRLTGHPVAVEGGIRFAHLPRNRDGGSAWRVHRFDPMCRENGIEHRLTKIKHPWINGQSLPGPDPGAERMNRTINDAPVTRCPSSGHGAAAAPRSPS